MIHQLMIAMCIAIPTVLSGFGMGFLLGAINGTDTANKRFVSLISGILTGLIVLYCLIWLSYQGFNLHG